MAAASPYTVNVDPLLAHELAAKGAALLVLGMPAGSYFGMDQHTYVVGPKFSGVKMIPPGPHFISYLAVSNGQTSPPTGFFLQLQPQQVEVRRWDAATETLVPMDDQEEAQRYAAGVRRYDFDQGMAPYNLPAYQAWTQLSRFITLTIIRNLSPACGNISIISEGQDAGLDLNQPKTAAERRLVEQLQQGPGGAPQQQQQTPEELSQQLVSGCIIEEVQDAEEDAVQVQVQQINQPDVYTAPDVNSAPDQSEQQQQQTAQPAKQEAATAPKDSKGNTRGRCRYTPLPRLIKQAGASAAELTALNMDKSTILRQVVSGHFNGQLEGLIGELQFAFIAFVYGQSLDAYAQWKAMLLLLLGCQSAAVQEWQLQFTQVLEVVTAQLRLGLGAAIPTGEAAQGLSPFGESMVEELLPDSFLRRAFSGFFNMLQENGSEVGPGLFQAAGVLKGMLHSRLGWDFDMSVMGVEGMMGSDDEDGPVVVENPEDWVRL